MDEKELILLCFRGFTFLRQEDRDGLRRLCWMGIVDGRIATIRVINQCDSWHVDYLNIDGKNPHDYLPLNYSFEDVIDFIKINSGEVRFGK